jgi:xanthine dehydrogenase accessory factor
MDSTSFFERVAELERARTPFALATVVVRHPPVSSHLGDRAIVFADGRMQGFVGGACSRDIVRRQAVAAMRSGTGRLVQIRPGAPPDADDAAPVGTVIVPMTCTSEGAVDVYVEPHLPPRILLVAGATPVAQSLVELGALLDGFRIVRVLQESDLTDLSPDERRGVITLSALGEFLRGLDAGDRASLVAVVATQGHYDEPVLEALLDAQALPYIGFLASRRRAAGVFATLAAAGMARERIERVHNPAGLDLGARRPGDVAISILAQIVATVAAIEPQAVRPESLSERLTADPVCGMDVVVASDSQRAEHDGQSYYFCGAGCRTVFQRDPSRYAVAAHA